MPVIEENDGLSERSAGARCNPLTGRQIVLDALRQMAGHSNGIESTAPPSTGDIVRRMWMANGTC